MIFGGRYEPVTELVWGYVLAGTLFSIITLQANLHIGIGRLRTWWSMLGIAALCTITLAVRHESLAQVIWTLNLFLTLAAAMQLVVTINMLRERHRHSA